MAEATGAGTGAGTGAEPKAGEVAWEIFLRELASKGGSFEDVAQASDSAKEELLKSLKLTPIQVAMVSAQWAKRRAEHKLEDSAAAELRREREYGRKPWLARREDERSARREYGALARTSVHDSFAAMAEMKKFTPEDAMALTYSLYGSEKTQQVQLLIYRKEGSERVKAHNYFCAEGKTEDWWNTYGPALHVLPYPLYPMTGCKEFDKLNALLLDQAAAWLRTTEGGGPRQPFLFPTSAYRTPTGATEGGEYFAPIVIGPDGKQAVDMSAMQEYMVSRDSANAQFRGGHTGRGRGQKQGRGRGQGQIRGPNSGNCYVCNAPDHRAFECPRRAKGRGGEADDSETCTCGKLPHQKGCPDF
jgi:hypothetical protein